MYIDYHLDALVDVLKSRGLEYEIGCQLNFLYIS
jgi:hypothetical protein